MIVVRDLRCKREVAFTELSSIRRTLDKPIAHDSSQGIPCTRRENGTCALRCIKCEREIASVSRKIKQRDSCGRITRTIEARAKCKLEEFEAKQKVAAQREKKAS